MWKKSQPPIGVELIVTTRQASVETAYFAEGSWIWSCGGCADGQITHWMHKPQPAHVKFFCGTHNRASRNRVSVLPSASGQA